MKLHFDKFTIAVLVVVGVLLAAAIFTVSRTNNSSEPAAYLTEDAPATPVVNAFLAFQDGDIPKARAQYSQAILARVDSTEAGSYGPLRGENYGYTDANRRLRVLKEQIDDTNPDRAFVTSTPTTPAASSTAARPGRRSVLSRLRARTAHGRSTGKSISIDGALGRVNGIQNYANNDS